MIQRNAMQRILAALIAAMGLINIVSALLVHSLIRSHLIHVLLPMEVVNASRSLTLIAGFGLLIVARGLWRGKHTAWLLTLVLLAGSAVVHLVKGLDWEEALGALLLGALLLHQRRQYTRRSDPPTLRRVPLFVAAGLLAILCYGLAGFWMLRAFQPFSLTNALQELGASMLWSDGPYDALVHGRAAWFLDSLGLLSSALALGTLGMLLRPVLPRMTSSNDRQRAEALLRRYASSSLAPFARADDKLLFFSDTVEGVIAYRVAGNVAVVCGDPIAAPEHVGLLARELVAFCAQQDWQVCFYEVQPRYLPEYAALGFEALKIGEDAWIELPQFTLKGAQISDIRHAVSKVERDGTMFHMLDPRADAALWQQIHAIEQAWRATQGGVELRFSIGHLPAQPDPTACYSVALAADARVLAYCAFLPIAGINGWALDVMRRAAACPNGTMEFLLARALEHFRDTGFAWASLGLAPLANVDAPRGSLLERGIRAVYANPRINATYHYQRLFFFKKKFNPQWRGGYLLFPNALALPQVLAAVVRVHVPALEPQLLIERMRGSAATAVRADLPVERVQDGAL